MKKLTQKLILGLLLVTMASCAQVFYAPDARSLAMKHQTIAIIPPTISIAAQRKVDAEAIREQQRTESMNFQSEMYSWLLRRKMQGHFSQDIQDIQTTNAKLQEVDYPYRPLTTAQLCELLGVDGIITSNFALSKPMSTGAAIAVAVLFGAAGSTNEVRGTISVSDCQNTKLIWNYEHRVSGGLGSSPASVVNAFMRRASKKMPYRVR